MARITEVNRGPLINIATWDCMVCMLFAVTVKIISKYAMVGRFQRDDAYMLGTGIVTLGQGIATSFQVRGGLGQHIATLSLELLERYSKATYAASILYVTSLCLARQSVLQFLATLARGATRQKLVKGVVICNGVWCLVAIIAVLFECGVPRARAIVNEQCFNKTIFWAAFGILDILLDLATSFLPVYLLHDLQINRGKKLWTMSAFAGRILLLPCIILRLRNLPRQDSADSTWGAVQFVLVTEFHVNASVITACVPFLKPFMDSLQSGILSMDLVRKAGPSEARAK